MRNEELVFIGMVTCHVAYRQMCVCFELKCVTMSYPTRQLLRKLYFFYVAILTLTNWISLCYALFQVATSQPGSQKHNAAAISKKTEVSSSAVEQFAPHSRQRLKGTQLQIIHAYLEFCICIHVGKAKTDSGAV